MLNTSVRTPEDVVSRYGGEEFVVILFDCEESVAEKVAARIGLACAPQPLRTARRR